MGTEASTFLGDEVNIRKPRPEGNDGFPTDFPHRDHYLWVGYDEELSEIVKKREKENVEGHNTHVNGHALDGRPKQRDALAKFAKGSSEDINRGD